MSDGNPNPNDESELLIKLLRAGGLVSDADVADFKSIAKELKIPFSQAIINSGLLNERNLKICIEAHQRVQQKQLKSDLAIRAVRVAVQKKCSLSAAIGSVKRLHQTTQVTVPLANELAKLLLEAGVISQEQLGSFLKKADESSMMIGQILVLEGILEVDGILAALNAVRMVRDQGVERDKAIKALKHAHKSKVSLEQALFELGFFSHPDAKTMSVGELFTMARVLSPKGLAECYEIELFKEKHFGQILLERGLATKRELEASVTLLSMVSKSELQPYQAAQALRRVCKEQLSMEEATKQEQANNQDNSHRLGDLLVEAGVLSRTTLESTVTANPDNAVKVGSSLLKARLISETILFAALRLQTLFRLGYLSRENTISLLKHCLENDLILDHALTEKELYVPSRMQWTWV